VQAQKSNISIKQQNKNISYSFCAEFIYPIPSKGETYLFIPRRFGNPSTVEVLNFAMLFLKLGTLILTFLCSSYSTAYLLYLPTRRGFSRRWLIFQGFQRGWGAKRRMEAGLRVLIRQRSEKNIIIK
jgi:hypothetical protein